MRLANLIITETSGLSTAKTGNILFFTISEFNKGIKLFNHLNFQDQLD